MKANYDFSNARRGPVVQMPATKTLITIRIDADIIDWFRSQVETRGGGNYQTLLNDALRAHIESKDQSLEKMFRRVVRDELCKAS